MSTKRKVNQPSTSPIHPQSPPSQTPQDPPSGSEPGHHTSPTYSYSICTPRWLSLPQVSLLDTVSTVDLLLELHESQFYQELRESLTIELTRIFGSVAVFRTSRILQWEDRAYLLYMFDRPVNPFAWGQMVPNAVERVRQFVLHLLAGHSSPQFSHVAEVRLAPALAVYLLQVKPSVSEMLSLQATGLFQLASSSRSSDGTPPIVLE